MWTDIQGDTTRSHAQQPETVGCQRELAGSDPTPIGVQYVPTTTPGALLLTETLSGTEGGPALDADPHIKGARACI